MSTIEKAMGKLRPQRKNKDQAPPPPPINVDTPDIQPDNVVHARKNHIELNSAILEQQGMIGDFPSQNNHIVKNEFRSIKHRLMKNAFGRNAQFHQNGNLVMVSSALPNEGKTFTAINLALSIATEKDKTVLLVDSDVLKPSVLPALGIKEHLPGLIEYLQGTCRNLSDVIYNTSVGNLKIIPSGKPHPQSNELLSSDRMAALANELASRYPDRIVIFDSPPVIGVVETVVLSHLVGQAMIVVEQDKTKISDVKHAIAQLDDKLAIGFVMNKVVRGSFMNAYGYGQDYGYGYGYGKDESASN